MAIHWLSENTIIILHRIDLQLFQNQLRVSIMAGKGRFCLAEHPIVKRANLHRVNIGNGKEGGKKKLSETFQQRLITQPPCLKQVNQLIKLQNNTTAREVFELVLFWRMLLITYLQPWRSLFWRKSWLRQIDDGAYSCTFIAKNADLWDMTLCSLIKIYPTFRSILKSLTRIHPVPPFALVWSVHLTLWCKQAIFSNNSAYCYQTIRPHNP